MARTGADASVCAQPAPEPVRTCVGCRTRSGATGLLRVVAVDGALVPDLRRRLSGRGAWLHPDVACLRRAERRKAFPRALRVPGPLDAGAVRRHLEQHSGEPSRCVGDHAPVTGEPNHA